MGFNPPYQPTQPHQTKPKKHMATRSFIAQKKEDGSFEGVYCHWDGYPDGVGKTLFANYKDPEKIQKLINGGGMSTLKETPEECEYYTQRGEALKIHKTLPFKENPNAAMFYLKQTAKNMGCEYLYVRAAGEWTYFKL
jgi:hypothetical protein